MWQFANNGPPLLDKEGLLSSCPTVPRAFSSLLSSPEANLLSFSFPRMHCSLTLSVSPEGIVLASIPASSFPPSSSPRTTDPFPCKLYVKWRTFFPTDHAEQPEHTRARLIKLGNILPHPCSYHVLAGWLAARFP